VVERILAFVERHRAPGRAFFISLLPDHVRAQAAASTLRWQRGAPLSPLDGVPFAAKDCVDALPHPTTAGTAFLASGCAAPRRHRQ
jgi:Asp-tRNA(Asn)/Glu-tRNA(Gln) amidotransferase A subunit family amidase